MSIAYQYNIKGTYIAPIEDGGYIPHNATHTPPPAPRPGEWPRWTGEEWELVEDHRPRAAVEVGEALAQEGTPYWLPGDTHETPARYMRNLGPLPEGALLTAPAAPQPTKEELFASLRATRDARISATDYLMMPDYPLTAKQRSAWEAYRQNLRDLPKGKGAPWDGGGSATPWPEQPEV